MAKNKAEKKVAAKGKAKKGEGHAAKAAADERDASAPGKKLSTKDYNRELKKLHGRAREAARVGRPQGAQGLHRLRGPRWRWQGRHDQGDHGAREPADLSRRSRCPTPTEREKSQMYGQRYLPHLPAAGEVVIWDRSWYNRAGVERVMGFCTEEAAKKYLKVLPGFEKLMVDSGIILLKYWLEVSPEEQTRRLEARIDDGRKIWKLSPMDIKSYTRWDDYTKARDDMFAASDTAWAPWYVASSEDKKRVRLNIISHLLSRIPYKSPPREKVKLPKRKVRAQPPAESVKRVPEKF